MSANDEVPVARVLTEHEQASAERDELTVGRDEEIVLRDGRSTDTASDNAAIAAAAHQEVMTELRKSGNDRLNDIHLDDLIEHQTVAVGRLAESVTQFGENFERREADRAANRRTNRILIAVSAVLVVLLAIGVLRLNAYSATNRENIKISRENTETVKDCVEPGGVCYTRNQANQANVIRLIVDSNKNGQIDTEEILDAIDKAKGQ